MIDWCKRVELHSEELDVRLEFRDVVLCHTVGFCTGWLLMHLFAVYELSLIHI